MKPNPGSDEAVKLGCLCPCSDNAYGIGAQGTSGENAIFWVNGDCPLHGIRSFEDLADAFAPFMKEENGTI